MIITPTTFSFLFRNVNTSHSLAATILEEQATLDVDIIFLQEITQKTIRKVANIDIADGEPVFGLPFHPAWTCLPPPSAISQVAIYVHKRVFDRFHFTVDGQSFGHPNIFVMLCFDPSTRITRSFINLYANPNRDCQRALSNTVPVFIQNLHKVNRPQLIQGDFNLHCSYWDEETPDNPSLAWDLIRGLHEHRLSLVNDESIPTFYRSNHRPQVLDLIWLNDDAYSWNAAEVVYDILGAKRDHMTLTLKVGSNDATSIANEHLEQSYIAAGSDDEGKLFDEIFNSINSWTLQDVDARTTQMIDAFQSVWNKYAKPGVARYNRWWNEECQVAKQAYIELNTIDSRAHFLRQCRLAKKAYFAKKIEEMIKRRKPWEGTGWIKQRAMPKVPQIVHNGEVLNDIDRMFNTMHNHFALSASMPIESDFIDSLPSRPCRTWHEFSELELNEALNTCSTASAPGPSHLSWEYLKIFCKDDDFRAFFLQLANDIVSQSVWPRQFKNSTTVVIPKPRKDDYSKPKSYRPIALLECPGKLISKMISARIQSDMIIYDIAHPLQFGGRRNHSTLDAGLYLTEYINKARNAGLYTTALALDAAQFFPSLNKGIIASILAKEGFSPIICKLFESYYDDRITKYMWNRHYSKDYDTDNGIPQGDPLSPVISVIYMSAMLKQLFPHSENAVSQCMSYIDDFVLLTSSPRLEDNIDQLENDYIKLSKAFNALGITIEASKTELMHFAKKQDTIGKGRKPIRFHCLHSMLPNIELHPTRRNTPTYIIPPSKEWRYLGFYFDTTLSFISHTRRYAAKALVATNNLRILGHSLGGLDPQTRRHVYQAIVWSVMSYGLPLWFKIDGKGCKASLKLLQKTQNVALRWISGAFRTTPVSWMEFVTGVPPVVQKANYMTRNALQRASKLPAKHILHHLAISPHFHEQATLPRHRNRPKNDNIWLLKKAIAELPPMQLDDEVTRIGERLLDRTNRVKVNIPAAPPRSSKVFPQWAEGWLGACMKDADNILAIGTDGSYKKKGQGVSAVVAQHNHVTTHTEARQIVAHSSFDAEMFAVNIAIHYIYQNVQGPVIVFIDNQATIKAMFKVTAHSAFELSRDNSQTIIQWLDMDDRNHIEFRWVPSHLGFEINELADSAADTSIVGPFPQPKHNIASRLRHNKASTVIEWRTSWSRFIATKRLKLKKKKKVLLPNCWDGKGNQFMNNANDIETFSRFTRLISGHAPTGEYRSRFFPNEPTGCLCFTEYQSHVHLLTECPRYKSKFSSIDAFYVANKNMVNIFKYLSDNKTAFTFTDEPIDIFDPP